MQFQDIMSNVFVPRNRYIVEDILFEECILVACTKDIMIM